jgi:ATP-dependent Clp protease protease subunit
MKEEGDETRQTMAQRQTVYVSFVAEINPNTAEVLLKVCADMANAGNDVYMLLNTVGGQINSGIAMYNILRALPTTITTHNVGAINSIGNVVFLAGRQRYANPGTTFMFHGASFDVQNQRFDERMLVERLEGLRVDQKKIAGIIANRTNVGGEDIEKLFLQAATWDAEFAKSHGIVHDIREAEIPVGSPVIQVVFKR